MYDALKWAVLLADVYTVRVERREHIYELQSTSATPFFYFMNENMVMFVRFTSPEIDDVTGKDSCFMYEMV